MATQYQILDVASMGKYKPTDYTRTSTGAVMLNQGVNPIAGTYKVVGDLPALNQPTYDNAPNPYVQPNIAPPATPAPAAPPVTPTQVPPSTVSSAKLNPADPNIKSLASQKQLGVNRLNTFFGSPTFDQTILGKQANSAFLNAISLAKTGSIDPNIMNYKGTVSDALEKFGLGNLAPNMGMQSDKAQAEIDAMKNPAMERVSNAYDDIIKAKTSQLGDNTATKDYLIQQRDALNAANREVELARQKIADKTLLDAQTLKNYENKIIPMGEIQKQQSRFTADEYMENLVNTQDYNNKLILAKMSEGNFLTAQKMNQDAADMQAEIETLQLNKALAMNQIEEKEAEKLQNEINFKRDMAKDGYMLLDSKSYAQVVKEYGITPDTFSNFLYKDVNGDIYLRPAGKSDTESFVDDKGYVHYIDKSTGKEVSRSTVPVGKTKTQAPNVTLINQGEQSADLTAAVGRLNTSALGADGKYDSQKVLNESIEWDISHPERQGALLNAVKNRLNMNDPLGKQLYTGKVLSGSGAIKVTNPNGVSIEINK